MARALGIFAVGGIGTAALDCTIEAAMHKSDFQERTAVQMVKRKLVVEDSTGFRQERTAMSIEPAPGLVGVFSQNVGSSGALMAMISIVAIAIPQSKWGLMFIPYSMAARTMYGGLVAFDVAGVLGITPNMGIGHMGHLCGDVMGVLIYVLWLKRLPVSLIMKRMRKDAGFR